VASHRPVTGTASRRPRACAATADVRPEVRPVIAWSSGIIPTTSWCIVPASAEVAATA
jgi:hypothetical protein